MEEIILANTYPNKKLDPFFVSSVFNFGTNFLAIFPEKLVPLFSLLYPNFNTILLFEGTTENFPSEISYLTIFRKVECIKMPKSAEIYQ
jgi:hypothetical protein